MSKSTELKEELDQVHRNFECLSMQVNRKNLGKQQGMKLVNEMNRLVGRKHQLDEEIALAKKPSAENDEHLIRSEKALELFQEEERKLDYERGPLIAAKEAACAALTKNDRALVVNGNKTAGLKRAVTERKGFWNERENLLESYRTNLARLLDLDDASNSESRVLHDVLSGLVSRLEFVERSLGLRESKDNPWAVAPKPPEF